MITDLIRRPRNVAALDIGSGAIKMVKLEKKASGYSLSGLAIRDLPPETIVAEEVRDRDAVIFNIKSLVDQIDPRTREVGLAISGHGVITDKISIDKKSGSEAEQAILFEAEQRAPFDVEDVTLDYHVITVNEETNKMDVLLVAARNEYLRNYLQLIIDADLKPVLVDTDAFAILNAYEINYELDAQKVTALVDIGFDSCVVTFVKDGVYHSTREVSSGGRIIYDAIQKEFRLNNELTAKAIRGELEGTVDPDMLRASIISSSEELFSGLEVAFSYFKTSAKVPAVEWIVLSGGGALIPFLPEFMQSKFNIPVEIANPLRNIDYDPDQFRHLDLEKIAPLLMVPIGLAARRVK